MGLWACLVAGVAPVLSAADWKTGPALQRQLATPLSITWVDNPFRRAMTGLAASQDVAILLDRRLDPERKIKFSADNQPLERVFQELAVQQKLGVSFLGPVVYFGPPETTGKLATLAAMRLDQAANLPPASPARRGLVVPSALAWEDLDTPREIVERIAKAAGVRLINPERIPHDLWPATSLPPMSAAEKLTLVLAGFDLAYELSPDGSAIRPIPLPATVSVARTYPAGASAAAILKQIGERYKDVRAKLDGTTLLAEGRVEDLNAIGKLLRGETVRVPAPANPMAKQVYSLTVDNKPIGGILPALGKQLGLEVEFDPALSNKLGQLISFRVKDATLEELLQAAVGPAGMRYELDGTKVKVFAKE